MKAEKQETTSNSFVNTFCQIREGDSVSEASDKLQELVAAVRETGRPGTLTIAIKVKPGTTRGRIGTIILEDDIAAKLPKKEKDESLFFATDDNTLQRTDPNQPELSLKTVEGGKVEKDQLKRVNG